MTLAPETAKDRMPCGWHGGIHGPPSDGHWHCYCDSPQGICLVQVAKFDGVHLSFGEACPDGNLCGISLGGHAR